MPKDVFISHATEDQATAAEVCVLLEGRGVGCWIAPRDVAPGAVWDQTIVRAIDSRHTFLLILSAKANDSPFVNNEVNRAFSQRKAIFTFRVEDVVPSGSLEFYLARHHWTDGFPPPLGKKVDALAAAIKEVVQLGEAHGIAGATATALPPPRMSRLATVRSAIRRLPTRERWWMGSTAIALVAVVALSIPAARHARESTPDP